MPSAVPVLFSPKEYVNQFPEKGNLITEIVKISQFYSHLSIFVKKIVSVQVFVSCIPYSSWKQCTAPSVVSWCDVAMC